MFFTQFSLMVPFYVTIVVHYQNQGTEIGMMCVSSRMASYHVCISTRCKTRLRRHGSVGKSTS